MLVVPLRGDNITNGEGINQTVKQYTGIKKKPACYVVGIKEPTYFEDIKQLKKLPAQRVATELKSATARLTITDIGTIGELIEVFIDDNLDGEQSMGTYEVTGGDTNKIVLATHIAAALSLTTSNGIYSVTSSGNVITITAPSSAGATMNGERLRVVIS
jgi:hypothetical protein